jgi:hypothetical protein
LIPETLHCFHLRHNKRCSALTEGAKGFLDLLLRLRIDRTRSFIEQYNRRLLQDGPRNGNPLKLAAGKLYTTLANPRVVTCGIN